MNVKIPFGHFKPVGLLFIGFLLFGGTVGSDIYTEATEVITPQSLDSMNPSRPKSDSLTIAEAVHAVRQEDYEEAIAQLGPLVNSDSISRHPRHGSAATWLGRAFEQRGNLRQAINVWTSSLQTGRHPDDQPPPADAAHALLRSLPSSILEREARLASETYNRFLHILSTPKAALGTLSLAADTILRRRAARLALIAPDSLSAPLSTYAAAPPKSSTEHLSSLSPDTLSETASRLQDWLRAQDPILATKENERIVEHLKRVREAQTKFAWSGRASGLDDRGEVYVQYGPPTLSTAVTSPSTSFQFAGSSFLFADNRKSNNWKRLLQKVGVSPESFPAAKNEAWKYSGIDPELHFIFVRDEGEGSPYKKGTVEDLLPPSLRLPPNKTFKEKADGDMSEEKAYFSIYSSVYQQLQGIEPRYRSRLSRLSTFNPGGPGSTSDPSQFLQKQFGRYNGQNSRMQQEREAAPNQQTTYSLDYPDLAVSVRTARFLEKDGKTRTEVYWKPKGGALTNPTKPVKGLRSQGFVPADSTLVQTTGVLRSASLHQEDRISKTDTFSISKATNPKETSSQPLLLRGDARRHTLEVEWLQYPIEMTRETGPLARTTKKEIGPQPSLSADPSQLEMSDILPLSPPEGGEVIPESRAGIRQRVMPYRRIEVGRPIALSFEVYRLAFNREDRTRYSIKYTTEYTVDEDGLAGLFGAEKKQSTSNITTYEGSSRNTSEYILFEPSSPLTTGDQDISEPIPLTVTVQVTDDVTNKSIERSIRLTYVPSKED